MGKRKLVPHRVSVSAPGYAEATTKVQLLAQTTVHCAVTITDQVVGAAARMKVDDEEGGSMLDGSCPSHERHTFTAAAWGPTCACDALNHSFCFESPHIIPMLPLGEEFNFTDADAAPCLMHGTNQSGKPNA